jgi:drug/metabolite transporter (DMT)-like permease
VGPLGVTPVIVEWSSAVLMALLVSPLAWRDRAAIGPAWRAHWALLAGVAAISSASYILFLTALGLGGVARVAPARETSILFGVLLGARVLGEGAWRRRLVGAAAMTAGVALLALR